VADIILVDDHTLFRAGLKALLAPLDDLEVVAEASTAREGLEAIERSRCDLAVIDLNLPDQDGRQLALAIRQRRSALPILVLSQHDDPLRVRQIMQCGCNGYLVKTAEEDELITAIRVTAAGGMYVHPSVAQALLGRDAGRVLTEREEDMLSLLPHGLSNQEIADRLHVSLGTIKRDLSNLYERFSVSDRTHLLAEAINRGLIEPRA
jgi:DNA-binding NarL/FixJ family response regulator